MSITNPSFEDAGANPGDALGWTRAVVSSAEEIADFGSTGTGVEDLESGWDNDSFLFSFVGFGTDILQAAYANGTVTPGTNEGFEYGWNSNQAFAFALGSSTFATFSGNAFENFEQDWANVPYLIALPPYGAFLEPAQFDGNDYENFEQSWDNDSYLTAFAGYGTDLTRASFKESEIGFFVESFEGVATDRAFTVNSSTDFFTATGHGFLNGDKLLIIADEDGTVPEGLSTAITYFVVNKTTDTFKLSLSFGGSAVDVRSDGSGGNLVRRDPALYWVDFMQTI